MLIITIISPQISVMLKQYINHTTFQSSRSLRSGWFLRYK